MRTKGNSPTPVASIKPTDSSKAAQRHVQAFLELYQILQCTNTAARADNKAYRGVGRSESSVSPFAIALAQARTEVDDAQLTVDTLTIKAAEEQTSADTKKACYFEARARAVEVAIAREDTEVDGASSLDEETEALTSLEYEYRTATMAATVTEANLTTATTKLKMKVRRLANISPNEQPARETQDQQINQSLTDMPNATAQEIRESSRSTIQRLLTTFVSRKRECASVSPGQASDTVPPADKSLRPSPLDMPPTLDHSSYSSDTQNLGVTMVESHVTFGHTKSLDDLGGGDVTPPVFPYQQNWPRLLGARSISLQVFQAAQIHALLTQVRFHPKNLMLRLCHDPFRRR